MATKPTTKVVIALPCADSAAMKAKTAHSIGGVIIRSKDKVVDFVLRLSCDIVSNRTELVNVAIEKGGTHILFVDSDMLFPSDALEKMLSHKKEIVGVEYNKRQFPLEAVYKPLVERSKELYKAEFVGTGLLLIDLEVFKKIKGPYFNFGRNSQGALVLGEDVWFCNTARDAGFDVWVDPTIRVGHIGEYVY